MLLKMKTQYAGPAGVCAPGKTIEIKDKAHAYALVEGGFAEQVEDSKSNGKGKRGKKRAETATLPVDEDASTRDPGPAPRKSER